MVRSAGARYRVPFDVPELSYEDAIAVASDTGTVVSKDGPLLETVIDMLDELERPDAHFDAVQIAGTNGKTSTARFTAAILAGEGLRTALSTSPHLVRYPERMEIDGAVVSDAQFAHGVSVAYEAGKRVNARRASSQLEPYQITPFDLLTVGSLVIFAEERVDVAVLEVGLGGRWDATSATNPVGVAITGIGLDHMRILGDTLAKIAAEKAAIIKPGRFVVLGEGTHEPSVQRVMDERCAACDVTPLVVEHELLAAPSHLGEPLAIRCPGRYGAYDVSLYKPLYQAQNIACAVTVAERYLGHALNEGQLNASLVACPTPGRFDVRSTDPFVLIDACHNPQSCEAFVSSLDEIDPDVSRRPTLVFATLSDKDAEGIASILVPAFPRVVVTQTAAARARDAASLAELVRRELVACGRSEDDVLGVYPTVSEACSALFRAHMPFVAAGTITLAGEVAALLEDPALPEDPARA